MTPSRPPENRITPHHSNPPALYIRGMCANEASIRTNKTLTSSDLCQIQCDRGMKSDAPRESNGPIKASKYQNGVNTIPLMSKALRLAIQTPAKFNCVKTHPKNNAHAQRSVGSSILFIPLLASSFKIAFRVMRSSDLIDQRHHLSSGGNRSLKIQTVDPPFGCNGLLCGLPWTTNPWIGKCKSHRIVSC